MVVRIGWIEVVDGMSFDGDEPRVRVDQAGWREERFKRQRAQD